MNTATQHQRLPLQYLALPEHRRNSVHAACSCGFTNWAPANVGAFKGDAERVVNRHVTNHLDEVAAL